MGCCFSNEKDHNGLDRDKVNEKTRLLHEDGPSVNRQPMDDSNRSISSITKTDEQSMLNKILHKTASDIIDVSAIRPHSMEKTEYLTRMKHYLEITSSGDFKPPKKQASQTANTQAPYNVLMADTVSQSDINMITESVNASANAMSSIEIVEKEPLVVPFGVEPMTA